MKARIEEDGKLVIVAEDSCEAFCLRQWTFEKYCLSIDTDSYKKTIAWDKVVSQVEHK